MKFATQIEAARNNVITEEMRTVAEKELPELTKKLHGSSNGTNA